MHYGQPVPFLAICAPCLSQLIHAPNPAPSLIDEASLSFDWDGRTIMLPAQLPSEDPNIQTIREALSLLFGIQAIAHLVPLSQNQILLRSDCKAALAAFCRDSFHSIALQDIATKYQQLILETPAIPALLLFAPGKALI